MLLGFKGAPLSLKMDTSCLSCMVARGPEINSVRAQEGQREARHVPCLPLKMRRPNFLCLLAFVHDCVWKPKGLPCRRRPEDARRFLLRAQGVDLEAVARVEALQQEVVLVEAVARGEVLLPA